MQECYKEATYDLFFSSFILAPMVLSFHLQTWLAHGDTGKETIILLFNFDGQLLLLLNFCFSLFELLS